MNPGKRPQNTKALLYLLSITDTMNIDGTDSVAAIKTQIEYCYQLVL